jgi:hypothetical protein
LKLKIGELRMTTKLISKEKFIDFLKQTYPDCFDSGTPMCNNSVDAFVIIKKREYTKQFCSSLSNDVQQIQANKKFKEQLKNIEDRVGKYHIDLGDN